MCTTRSGHAAHAALLLACTNGAALRMPSGGEAMNGGLPTQLGVPLPKFGLLDYTALVLDTVHPVLDCLCRTAS